MKDHKFILMLILLIGIWVSYLFTLSLPTFYQSQESLDEAYNLGKTIGDFCDDYDTSTDLAICAHPCYYNYTAERMQTMCAIGVYDTAGSKRNVQ